MEKKIVTFPKLTLLRLKVVIADDFVCDTHQNNVLVQFKPKMNQFLSRPFNLYMHQSLENLRDLHRILP